MRLVQENKEPFVRHLRLSQPLEKAGPGSSPLSEDAEGEGMRKHETARGQRKLLWGK